MTPGERAIAAKRTLFAQHMIWLWDIVKHGKYNNYEQPGFVEWRFKTNMTCFSMRGFINSKECLKVGCQKSGCIDRSFGDNEFQNCLTDMDSEECRRDCIPECSKTAR